MAEAKAAYLQKSGERVCYLELASSHWQRLKGLMFRRRISACKGMLLSPCSGVHTFWMRFPIDVLALDSDYRVIGLDDWVFPWRISFRSLTLRTRHVIELSAGRCAELGITNGDLIDIRTERPACSGAGSNQISN